MNKHLIWYNDEIIPFDEASVHVLSPSTQFGISVFEGIRGYWNEDDEELYCFRVKDHYDRLEDSAKIMRLNKEYDKDDFIDAMHKIITANNHKEDIAIRHILMLDDKGSWYSNGPVGMVVSTMAKGRAFADKNGIDSCFSSWVRINDNSTPPRMKAGANYLNSRMAQMEANNNNYDVPILVNKDGNVAEGPGACIFMIKNNKLITPDVSSDILESITRDTIIELANNELNLTVEERKVDKTEFYTADEAFFCGTSMEVVHIKSIDKFSLKSTEPNSITNKIRDLYFKVVRGKVNKYKDWLTPIYNKS